MPVKTLKKVVLPAPLGPMIDAIWPSSRVKSSVSSAVRPPKRLEMPRASRMMPMPSVGLARRPVRELAVAPAGGQDALGPEDHHEDEDQAEHHPLVLGGLELGGEVGEAPAEDRGAGVAQLVEPEGEALEHLEVEHGHHGGPEYRARDGAHAAQDHHGEHPDGLHE